MFSQIKGAQSVHLETEKKSAPIFTSSPVKQEV